MKRVNIHTLIFLLGFGFPFSSFSQSEVWTLEQCIDTALANNRSLQIKRNNILLSQEKQGEAKANLIPKIMLNADYKYFTNLPYQLLPLSVFGGPEGQFKEAQFGVPHNLNANLQLTMPLYNAQVFGGIKMSESAIELQELQHQKSEEQTVFEISNIYYNLLLIKQQLAFLDSNKTNAAQLLKTTRLLKEHLMAKGTDVSKVELQMAQLENQQIIVQSKREQLFAALKFAMGVSDETNLEIDLNMNIEMEKKYISRLSLDAQLIGTQNKLMKTELSMLKNSRLPSLALFGTYGITGYGYDKKPNNFLNFYPIGFAGIQLQYPLFNGTITQRKISQKNIELTNLQLQTELVNDQTDLQIKNALLQRSAAAQSIENTRIQIEWAKSIYNQTLLQNKNGVASLTDIILTDNALREAQQSYINATIDYLKADLELKKSTSNLMSNGQK
jgi:OMF family outer membrane factor